MVREIILGIRNKDCISGPLRCTPSIFNNLSNSLSLNFLTFALALCFLVNSNAFAIPHIAAVL